MIKYIHINDCNRTDLTRILNDKMVRRHLVDHPEFGPDEIEEWVKQKAKVDKDPNCRVRGIVIKGELAGWCGIQVENGQYDLGIILSPAFWGYGHTVFWDLLKWSKELEHKEVFIHLLESRPESKAIQRRIGASITSTQMMGRSFRSYKISV